MFNKSLPNFPYEAKVTHQHASFCGYKIWCNIINHNGFDYLNEAELTMYTGYMVRGRLELKTYVSVEFIYLIGGGI